MTQRRHHYERAFEEYLRRRAIPYVAVDEARKALLPDNADLRIAVDYTAGSASGAAAQPPRIGFTQSLKSFDMVVYGDQLNLLIELKGRKITPTRTPSARARLESWVTQDDVDALTQWQHLFGSGFEAAFVFVYWCDEQPPDALFQEIFEYQGRWYALRAISLAAYRAAMKPRSARWRTVDLPASLFSQLSQPFASLPGSERQPPHLTPFDLGPELPALHPFHSQLGSVP